MQMIRHIELVAFVAIDSIRIDLLVDLLRNLIQMKRAQIGRGCQILLHTHTYKYKHRHQAQAQVQPKTMEEKKNVCNEMTSDKHSAEF